MTKVGEHITLDIIGTTKEYDPSVYEKVIQNIAKVFLSTPDDSWDTLQKMNADSRVCKNQ